ncbi:NUDIX hydrolase [Planotetraspora kaengkrachanensis]|uniref:NUDIX hydrolase n=1 Tax=Planotetraspora kaengkrachanensis TaxID=575193 RepID=A0A8J3LXY0_9ACTN|nr:NUDIX hydrolase [Planotetraspora kaengkrachanensis]GIG79889.1 NUDIX hydrolase [Planotetraspora kaengkrachanensis]
MFESGVRSTGVTDMIRAAGAVVWRGDEADPEVALVHRPKYDDWSFPKGKLKPGEHVIVAALREVREETGLDVVFGRPLPPSHYLKDGRLKRVDYWAARVVGVAEEFPYGDEVDEVVWLPLDEARRRLTYEWDAGLLRALTALPLATVPLIFVRHGLAGSRQEWKGDDDLRPLDESGWAQSAAFTAVLGAYRPAVLVSSPSLRCVQMLKPYADDLGMRVREDLTLSEDGYDPRAAERLVGELAASGEPAVVCSHGKVLPELLAMSCRDRPDGDPAEVELDKGAFAVLNRAAGRLVSVEHHLT